MKKISLLVTGSNGLIAKTFIEQYKDKFKILKCTKKDKLENCLKKKTTNNFQYCWRTV